jgi:hypothetical protein
VGLYFYFIFGDNKYIDIFTLFLLFILAIENIFMLSFEKRKRDPFVLLMVTIVTIFYMGRILTFMYNPYSPALDKNQYFTSFDLNYSLTFIILSNASIFLGLNAAKGRILYKEAMPSSQHNTKHRNIIILLLIAIIITFSNILPTEILGRVASYIQTFFINCYLILLFTFVYIAINYKNIKPTYRTILLFLIIIFVLFNTLAGNRSGILTLAVFLMIASLSFKGTVILNKKAILIATILIPISIILFYIATYIRQISANRGIVSTQQLAIIKESNIFDTEYNDYLNRTMFFRLGFLDPAADVIKNKERYSRIINIVYYFKSIIDNVLTPGFNVFDTPKVANSLRYIYRDLDLPKHEDIMAAYNSDMLTIYGEYYVLFGGYFALIIFFIISYIFKTIYLSVKSKDIFLFYLYRALILFIFYSWLNSFGLDWMMFDIISIFITVFLFKNFYRSRQVLFATKEPLQPSSASR